MKEQEKTCFDRAFRGERSGRFFFEIFEVIESIRGKPNFNNL